MVEEKKQLRIEAFDGKDKKTLTFEVPNSFAEHLANLGHLRSQGQEVFKVDGNKKITLRLTVFSQSESF